MRVSGTRAELQYLTVTSDFTAAAWNTVAQHRVLTVTGSVRALILPRITGSLTSGGALTNQIGITGSTAAFVGATAVAAMTLNNVWLSTTPAAQFAFTSLIDRIVAASQNIGYEILVAAATAGTIVWECYWEPLSSTGNVVAATGGAL